ncbi:putative nucleoside-diphosphate-sugar epimerase (plasmid) [Acidisarcina polymorpha]|uniref:NADPH:quinone oxidoreductase 2 n=1 Tax=Acidisarcina polymorpha TaxID=2211140 RepID=A0A2Z5GAS5_9BACT|nr:NmrA family NAD(P)-binding protein [Acidisarcina polymorpha]AXC16320.1 NADPH:quinone oxidoreductase 2 [Acidisarcina polymorpha]AXC16352.1 putative nucleoside-diphosphate-sugar epimerase [Acidisarcina polymorpha]
MFAVMGITGNVGGAVADTLLQHGEQVRGIVRDLSKAQAWQGRGVEVVPSNYDDLLIEAFRGVEGVFIMIPPNMVPEPGFPDSVARIAAIKKAIIAAKPPRAVFLSSWGAEQPSGLGLITPNRILEQELADTGVPGAFLRPAWFMENLVYSLSGARSSGNYFSFYQPLKRPYAMVATKDVGVIGAQTLLQSWHRNRFIEISGPASYSSEDAAAALAAATGRPVTAVAVPREQWVDTLAQNGMPGDRSGAYIEMVDSLNSGWIHFGVPGTEQAKGGIDLIPTVTALAEKSE